MTNAVNRRQQKRDRATEDRPTDGSARQESHDSLQALFHLRAVFADPHHARQKGRPARRRHRLQQGRPVGERAARVQLPQRPLVRCELTVCSQTTKAQPHERIKPVHGQRQQLQPLAPVVTATQVRNLVDEDVFPIFRQER